MTDKPIPAVRPADVPEGQPAPMVPYQCYLNLNGQQAVESFTARYGKPPEQLFFYHRLIWAGPVPGQN